MKISGGSPVEVVSPGETDRVLVSPAHVGSVPHYANAAHNVLTEVWAPASGLEVHVNAMVVTAEGAGVITISFGGSTAFVFRFAVQGTRSASFSGDICLAADEKVEVLALFTNVNHVVDVTVVGHEEEP